MKTPSRKFTVEFKSARRRQKGPTNSIWGETDFEALAREAKVIAPHLFNSTEATAAHGRDERPPVDPNPRFEVDNTGKDAEPPVASTDNPEVKASTLHEPSPQASDAVVEIQEAPPISQRRARPKRQKRLEFTPIDVHEDKTGQTLERLISSDELAALEVENRRLKNLLAARLREQNLQLNKMLERFRT
ncbi:hypothetical protein ILFOPFJJ_06464 [Ensifer psoraleae]|uniref:hypothetical protein n=1 Tax=Sinorhizobium psoraleae TaxID=520838 RepID=UPI001567D0E1|nr:hypothetical protein [Sinorhizobium psoraleae]NRP75541.1 hypothetical protein [Sinorhizobium psoraleae]